MARHCQSYYVWSKTDMLLWGNNVILVFTVLEKRDFNFTFCTYSNKINASYMWFHLTKNLMSSQQRVRMYRAGHYMCVINIIKIHVNGIGVNSMWREGCWIWPHTFNLVLASCTHTHTHPSLEICKFFFRNSFNLLFYNNSDTVIVELRHYIIRNS